MKYKLMKQIASLLLVFAIFLSHNMTAVAASDIKTVLPSAGMGIDLSQSSQSLQTIAKASNKETVVLNDIEDTLDVRVLIENYIPEDDMEFANVVIAQVNDYVNVRSMPSEEGEIVGKLYNNSVGDLLSETDGWYEISSGNVVGYVKAEYCVTGKEAIELAKLKL